MANNFAGKSIAGIDEQEGAIAVEPVRLFYLSVKLTIPEYLLEPLVSEFPLLLQQLMSTGFSAILLAYLVMPCLTQLFCKWLYPAS